MASFSKAVANGYTLTLTVTTSSQSVADNTSVISWVLTLAKGHTFYVAKHTGSVYIAGVKVWEVNSSTFNAAPSRSTMTIASGTRTIAHNSAGEASVYCSASLGTDAQGSDWSLPNTSVSGSLVLPKIARAPNAPGAPAVSQADVNREISAISPVATINGAAITGYQIQRTQYFSGLGWSGWQIFTVSLGARRLSFIPDRTHGTFVFQGRAVTAAGVGPWSVSSVSIVGNGSGPMVAVAGVQKESDSYVRVKGFWRPAIAYVRRAGVWRETRR